MNQKEFEDQLSRWIRNINTYGISEIDAFNELDRLMHEIPQWGDESVVPINSDLLHLYRNHSVFWLHAISLTPVEHTFVLTGAKSNGEGGYVYVGLPTSVVETGLAAYFKQRQEKMKLEQGKSMSKVKLGFKKLDPNAQLPKYAHEGDAGMDVFALHDVELPLNKPVIVKTGIAAEIPDGYELQVRPRSGFAAKGITVWNAPGTIDSKYRGEIGVILFSTVPVYRVNSGDKIAQLVLAPVTFAEPYEVQKLSETDRGTGGFGSTGR